MPFTWNEAEPYGLIVAGSDVIVFWWIPPRLMLTKGSTSVAVPVAGSVGAGVGWGVGADESSSLPQPISAAPASPTPPSAEPRMTPRRETRLPSVRD